MPNSLHASSVAQQLSAVTEHAFLLRELSALIAGREHAAVLAIAAPQLLESVRLDEIVWRIRPLVRSDDLICLLDDGSLVILLRDVADKANAIGAAQRLFQRCAAVQTAGLAEGGSALSFGIVMLPCDMRQASSVLLQAQQAARYAARTHARWVCWSDGQDATEGAVLSREDDRAVHAIQSLDRGEFELFYQPQLDMKSGALRGLEALARWRRDGQLIMPSIFVPEIEAAGLSSALGAWVLREACRQIAEWREHDVACPRIAINLSASQLRGDLVDVVKGALSQYDVAPNALEIEVTESAEISHPEEALAVSRELAALGVTFSLDDFGSGYSNFLRLRSAPFAAVKLERRFVEGVMHNDYDREMLTTVIDFCRRVGIQTIAEGIESQGQLDLLRAMGCNAWQGYLCSVPMSSAATTQFLAASVLA